MPWYEFKASAKGDQTELYLYNEIGSFGISASDFIADLQKVPKTDRINLHIHSPGGDVFDGQAIFTALSNHKGGVTTHVDGLAASMASVIALSGAPVKMAGNAMMMIHNVSGGAFGDSRDMRQSADLLDKVQETITSVYIGKTGLPRAEIEKMMDDETWLTATEAKELNFVDQITGDLKMAAKFDLSKFHNPPPIMTTNNTITTAGPNPKTTLADAFIAAPFSDATMEALQTTEVTTEVTPEAKPSLIQRVLSMMKEKRELSEVIAAHEAIVATKDDIIKNQAQSIVELNDIADKLQADLDEFKANEKALADAVKNLQAEAATAEQKAADIIAAQGFASEKLPSVVPADKVTSAEDLLAEFNSITDPAARTVFLRKNKSAIRKANAELKNAK